MGAPLNVAPEAADADVERAREQLEGDLHTLERRARAMLAEG